MLSALLKKQLQEIFRSYFYNAKQGKARSRVSTVGYFAFFAVLMVGVLGGMFTYLAHSLCAPFAAAGMEWLYFTIMAMVAIVLGAFGSVFNTYSSLYLAKDNDLLLSMPIPVRTILLSRLLSVYLMGLLYSGVVLLPAMIVYWVTVSAAPAALAGGLLLFVLVTIFVLTLSCALGWVVARVSLKLKHRSITVVLTSLLFLSAYYFVYFKAQSFLSELVTNAAYYGAQIRGKAYPLYLIGRAGAGDGPAMAVVTAVVLVLFVLLFWLLSRSFLRIATASGSTARVSTAKRPPCSAVRARPCLRGSCGTSAAIPAICSTAASASCCCRSAARPCYGSAIFWMCCSLWSAGRESRSSCARWCACWHP